MKIRLFAAAIIIFVLTGSVLLCAYLKYDYIDIDADILSHIPSMECKKIIRLNAGPIMINAINLMTNFFDELRDLNELISEIDHVQIGIYEIKNNNSNDPPSWIDTVANVLKKKGWERFVKVMDTDENVLILLKAKHTNISGILVTVNDGDNMVMVEVAGDLEKLLNFAVSAHTKNVNVLTTNQLSFAS